MVNPDQMAAIFPERLRSTGTAGGYPQARSATPRATPTPARWNRRFRKPESERSRGEQRVTRDSQDALGLLRTLWDVVGG